MYRQRRSAEVDRDNKVNYHRQIKIAKVLKWTYQDKTNSVGVGGCGMDMGFHLYTLASVLYKDGYW